MQPRPRRLRQGRIGGVANEGVPKAKRRTVTAGSDEQVTLDQPVAGLLDLGTRDPRRKRVNRPGLESVTRNRAECERGTLSCAQAVEPRGEEGVDPWGKIVR